MKGYLTASEILIAFTDSSARDDDHGVERGEITFAARSGSGGYVRVYFPSADPKNRARHCVIVERFNGAVTAAR